MDGVVVVVGGVVLVCGVVVVVVVVVAVLVPGVTEGVQGVGGRVRERVWGRVCWLWQA